MNDAYGDSLDHMNEGDRVRYVLHPGAYRESPDSELGQQGTILEIPRQPRSVRVRWDDDTTGWIASSLLVEDDEAPSHPCLNSVGCDV